MGASVEWQITNARLIRPGATISRGGVHLRGERIDALLGAGESLPDLVNLNLHGLPVFPGLVNAYDALPASFHRFDGPGRPYRNWLEFDNDLKSSALFKERMLLELEDLYRLGAYRSVLGATSTVLDHVPHFMRDAAPDDLPVNLLSDFGLSHSIGTFSLGWGDGAATEYARAAEAGLPYVTRIGEGGAVESQRALAALAEAGALGENTVLARGVGLDGGSLRRIAAAGASLIWCPESDLHLYEKTIALSEALQAGVNLCIGTDSAMAGGTNLLSGLAAATKLIQDAELEVSPSEIYQMVSENAARALHQSDTGAIEKNARADLLVLSAKETQDPFAALLTASSADIYLVVQGGRPVFGDSELEPIFTQAGVLFDRIEIGNRSKIIIHGFKKLLETAAGALGYTKEFAFLSGK